jgi:transcriptional regulator with XRE-family HTH domain
LRPHPSVSARRNSASKAKQFSFNFVARPPIFLKKKGFSQDWLSKEAEVAYNTIVKTESGENPNPTVDTLERIAKALGVSIEKLFKE